MPVQTVPLGLNRFAGFREWKGSLYSPQQKSIEGGERGSPDFDLDPFLVVSFIGSSVDFLGLQSSKIQKKKQKDIYRGE